MNENPEQLNNENENEYQTWFLVVLVFVIVSGILITVFNHDKIKPQTPHELVASAFNQILSTKGQQQIALGQNQPLVYHPAGAQSIVWQPLPPRNTTNVPTQNKFDSKWIPLH